MTRDRAGTIGGRVRRSLALGGLAALGLTGCTDFAMYDLDKAYEAVPLIATMRTSVSYDPYELPRLPAPGSVPVARPGRDLLPAFTQAQLDSVGAVLLNPLPMSPEVLALGQQVYDNQCSVCHGPQGGGNGPVVGPGKYPLAPALTAESAVNRADGYIYGVIRIGRGLMPAYGEKIPHDERWALVNYVRVLQRGTGAQTAPAPSVPGGLISPGGTDIDPVEPVPGAVDTAQAVR